MSIERRGDNATVENAIDIGVGWNHLGAPGVSVCNMLNLDPKMTIGELRQRLGDRTWESTYEERMAEMAAELDAAIAAQAPGEWLTPEYNARRLREVKASRLARLLGRHRTD